MKKLLRARDSFRSPKGHAINLPLNSTLEQTHFWHHLLPPDHLHRRLADQPSSKPKSSHRDASRPGIPRTPGVDQQSGYQEIRFTTPLWNLLDPGQERTLVPH